MDFQVTSTPGTFLPEDCGIADLALEFGIEVALRTFVQTLMSWVFF